MGFAFADMGRPRHGMSPSFRPDILQVSFSRCPSPEDGGTVLPVEEKRQSQQRSNGQRQPHLSKDRHHGRRTAPDTSGHAVVCGPASDGPITRERTRVTTMNHGSRALLPLQVGGLQVGGSTPEDRELGPGARLVTDSRLAKVWVATSRQSGHLTQLCQEATIF